MFPLLSLAVPLPTTIYTTTLRNLLYILLTIPVLVSSEHQVFQNLISHYMAQKFILVLPVSICKMSVSIFNMFQYPNCLHVLYIVYRETLCRITCRYYITMKHSFSDVLCFLKLCKAFFILETLFALYVFRDTALLWKQKGNTI